MLGANLVFGESARLGDERALKRPLAPPQTGRLHRVIHRALFLAAALALAGPAAATLPSLMSPLSPQGPSIAHVEPTMGADLLLLALEYPSLARVTVAGTTEQGRPIHMLEVSNFDDLAGDEPYYYVDGTVHGNEEVAGEVAYFAARKLLRGFGADARATRLVEDARTVFVPIVNADGNLANPPTRKNANGVDLNRNFPWRWCEQPGASPNPSSQTYCGPGPGSEAETQAIMQVIGSLRPEIAISGHSGTTELLYPWGYTSAPTPDAAMFGRLASKFSAHTGIPASHALYPVTGASRDWVYGNYGVPAFTFEVDDFQASQTLTTSAQGYETRLAPAIEGTLWLLDHARDMRANVAKPTVEALAAGGARFTLANAGWGDATVRADFQVLDAPLAPGQSASAVVPGESTRALDWAPATTGDGQGTILAHFTYAPRKLVAEPETITVRYLVTIEGGRIVGIFEPEL